jgi:hypothetical protein
MSILAEQPSYSSASSVSSQRGVPLLQELPKLLEYRADADPDAEFIPKTIAGFSGGFLVMGACVLAGWALWMTRVKTGIDITQPMTMGLAFMVGVAGVAASLLLVGLKVRADHTGDDLYARHWLNSITTGAAFCLLLCGPLFFMSEGWTINRFVMAAVWMLLMCFPAVAAKWTVGPHPHLEVPDMG